MPSAEIHPISHGLLVWQNYDPEVKADLWSTAIQTGPALYLIDPIPLPEGQLAALLSSLPVAGIIVTNANHERSAIEYSDQLLVPLLARAGSFPKSKPTRFETVTAGEITGDLEAIEIEGAVSGEIAVYHPSDGGTLIIGDALINFDPYGFAFLPRKYCQDENRMRSSLRQLLDKPAERMLFAHGTPILSGATSRLRQLLESE